ncbi:MAG: hypothetical protein KDJ15_00155 [Alphaproteobacteria bacterium]|nr:hypothetical protein [Alphaproteobacteria bacterium]
MANKKISELAVFSPPYAGGEDIIVNKSGVATYRADLRYLGLADASLTYNGDGTVNTLTKAGRTKTFTYSSGVLQSWSDGTVTTTFGYDGGGNVDSITVA